MSLKRYYISGLRPHIWEHPEGEMVYFEDYVTLQAENARLKAEVERLHRNGDLMLKFAAANMTYPAYATMAKDWNAAKEGKPTSNE